MTFHKAALCKGRDPEGTDSWRLPADSTPHSQVSNPNLWLRHRLGFVTTNSIKGSDFRKTPTTLDGYFDQRAWESLSLPKYQRTGQNGVGILNNDLGKIHNCNLGETKRLLPNPFSFKLCFVSFLSLLGGMSGSERIVFLEL